MLKCCSIALGFCGFKAISLEERIEELEKSTEKIRSSLEERIEELEESTEEITDELKNTKKKLKEANMMIFNLQEKMPKVNPLPPKPKKINTNNGWNSTRGWEDKPKVINSAPQRSSTNVDFEDDHTAADNWQVYKKTQKSGASWDS
jgi:uncharacterized coiled-coil protein SlyX